MAFHCPRSLSASDTSGGNPPNSCSPSEMHTLPALLPSHQQHGIPQHHHSRPAAEPNASVAVSIRRTPDSPYPGAFAQTPPYPRTSGASSHHSGQRRRPFQHTQGFQQQLVLIRPDDVVIDIVAHHGVKALIGEIQPIGVAVLKGTPGTHALAGGVFRTWPGRSRRPRPSSRCPLLFVSGHVRAARMDSAPEPQPTSSNLPCPL